MSSPILKLPNFEHPFILQTDASNFAIGVVLSQVIDEQEHPVAFASRQLNSAESKYATIEKEALAIKWGIQYFRHYVYGTHFTIQTDHNPLRWLMSMKDSSQRLTRWALALQDYDFDIEYRKGSENGNADALSRMPASKPKTQKPVSVSAVVQQPTDVASVKLQQGRDPFCRQIQRKLQDPTAYLDKNISIARFVVQSDILYYRSRTGGTLRLVVPVTMQYNILNENHNLPIAGHLGYGRTLAKLKPRFYWHNMDRDVKWFCASCVSCQKRKVDTKPKAPLVNIPVYRKAYGTTSC